jgi:hypothetical protein
LLAHENNNGVTEKDIMLMFYKTDKNIHHDTLQRDYDTFKKVWTELQSLRKKDK